MTNSSKVIINNIDMLKDDFGIQKTLLESWNHNDYRSRFRSICEICEYDFTSRKNLNKLRNLVTILDITRFSISIKDLSDKDLTEQEHKLLTTFILITIEVSDPSQIANLFRHTLLSNKTLLDNIIKYKDELIKILNNRMRIASSMEESISKRKDIPVLIGFVILILDTPIISYSAMRDIEFDISHNYTVNLAIRHLYEFIDLYNIYPNESIKCFIDTFYISFAKNKRKFNTGVLKSEIEWFKETNSLIKSVEDCNSIDKKEKDRLISIIMEVIV